MLQKESLEVGLAEYKPNLLCKCPSVCVNEKIPRTRWILVDRGYLNIPHQMPLHYSDYMYERGPMMNIKRRCACSHTRPEFYGNKGSFVLVPNWVCLLVTTMHGHWVAGTSWEKLRLELEPLVRCKNTVYTTHTSQLESIMSSLKISPSVMQVCPQIIRRGT